jgi:hypothetical protein
LSPLKQTSAAPAAIEARTGGSSASSLSTPDPRSSITGTPSAHSASIPTSSTKPTVRKFDGWTRRITSAPAVSARA